MELAKITSKGQVTIPVDIRKKQSVVAEKFPNQVSAVDKFFSEDNLAA